MGRVEAERHAVLEDSHRLRAEDFRVPAGRLLQLAAGQGDVGDVASFGDRGRLLLRYSGTELLARVMIEGEDEEKVRSEATSLAKLIKEEIGV